MLEKSTGRKLVGSVWRHQPPSIMQRLLTSQFIFSNHHCTPIFLLLEDFWVLKRVIIYKTDEKDITSNANFYQMELRKQKYEFGETGFLYLTTHLLWDSFKGNRKENHEVEFVKDEAKTLKQELLQITQHVMEMWPLKVRGNRRLSAIHSLNRVHCLLT